MLAFAHTLYQQRHDFTLYYSAPSADAAAFDADLTDVPWAGQVQRCYSADGARLDLEALPGYQADTHVYVCGPDGYMAAILEKFAQIGYQEAALHSEYFVVPELPEYENHSFLIERLNGQMVPVLADQSASDALIAAGVPVDIKCADGLCGVCKCDVVDGDVEHRDFVLSKTQRSTQMILCQSRATHENGIIKLKI